MSSTIPDHIDFDAPATLRKWPSLKNERVPSNLGAKPYLVAQGTLDACIKAVLTKPAHQQHLYEIHTAPQGAVVGPILSPEDIQQFGRLREYL